MTVDEPELNNSKPETLNLNSKTRNSTTRNPQLRTTFAAMLQSAKFIRVFFAFFFLAILLLIYGYLPLTLDINIDGLQRVGRDYFFYSCIGLFIFFNLITYFFRYLADRSSMTYYQRTAVHLLSPVLYLSMTLLIGYLGVVNNSSAMSSSTYGYLTYLSSAFLIIWIFIFLFTLVKKI